MVMPSREECETYVATLLRIADENHATLLRAWPSVSEEAVGNSVGMATGAIGFSELLDSVSGSPAITTDFAVELRIGCYNAALWVLTSKPSRQYRNHLATAQCNLGGAYDKRVKGDIAENRELSIECYTKALNVFTRASFPYWWAIIQCNLGTAYDVRIKGDAAENKERAIKHLKKALEVFTSDTETSLFKDKAKAAGTQCNLASVYMDRIEGEAAENMELAIDCCNSALRIVARESCPQEWASAQANLGEAYRSRIKGDVAGNLESAILCFNTALEVRTRDTFPEDWAMLNSNLGNVYKDRVEGDAKENKELAIRHHKDALEVYTRETFPEDWARVQMCLGNAFDSRIEGDRQKNNALAIACFERSLEVYTLEDFPELWASTLSNLGDSYRIGKEFARAIKCLEDSLSIRTRRAFPAGWAIVKMNLGIAYHERTDGDQTKNNECAIEYFKEALEYYDSYRAQLSHSRDSTEDKAAVARDAATCTAGLVDSLMALMRPAEALVAIERTRARALSELAISTDQQSDAASLKPEVVEWTTRRASSLALDRKIQAVEARLRSAPGAGQGAMLPAQHPDVEELKGKLKIAIECERLAREAAEEADPAFVLTREVIELTYATMQSAAVLGEGVVAVVWHLPPIQERKTWCGVFVVAAGLAEPLFVEYTWEEVQNIWKCCKVTSHIMRHSATLFSWPSETIAFEALARSEVLDFGLTKLSTALRMNEVYMLLQKATSAQQPPAEPSESTSSFNGSAAAPNLILLATGLLHAVPLHALPITNIPPQIPDCDLCADNADVETARATSHCRDCSKHCLLCDECCSYAHRSGNSVKHTPINIVKHLEAVHKPVMGELFSGCFYAPSLRMYGEAKRAHHRQCDMSGGCFDEVILVQNPGKGSPTNLDGADEEVGLITKLVETSGLDPTTLKHEEATRANLCAAVVTAEGKSEAHTYAVHMACHGKHRSRWDSGLALAEPDQLTVADVIAMRMPKCRLVVMSACESGLNDSLTDSAAEMIGLPSAMLVAGASCIISTLWEVDDVATALLMQKFYFFLLDRDGGKLPVSFALQKAQAWLRTLPAAEVDGILPPIMQTKWRRGLVRMRRGGGGNSSFPKCQDDCSDEGREVDATHWCSECGNVFFCSDCIKSHSTKIRLGSHKYQSLEEYGVAYDGVGGAAGGGGVEESSSSSSGGSHGSAVAIDATPPRRKAMLFGTYGHPFASPEYWAAFVVTGFSDVRSNRADGSSSGTGAVGDTVAESHRHLATRTDAGLGGGVNDNGVNAEEDDEFDDDDLGDRGDTQYPLDRLLLVSGPKPTRAGKTPQSPVRLPAFNESDWAKFTADWASGQFDVAFTQYFWCKSGPTREYWYQQVGSLATTPFVVLHVHFAHFSTVAGPDATEAFCRVTGVNARWSLDYSESVIDVNGDPKIKVENRRAELEQRFCGETGRSIPASGLLLTGKHEKCLPQNAMLSPDYKRVDVIKKVSTIMPCATDADRDAACNQFAAEFGIAPGAVSTSTSLCNQTKKTITLHIQVASAGAQYTSTYSGKGHLGSSASNAFTRTSRFAEFRCNQPGSTVGWRFLDGAEPTMPPAFPANPLGKPVEQGEPGAITPPVASASPLDLCKILRDADSKRLAKLDALHPGGVPDFDYMDPLNRALPLMNPRPGSPKAFHGRGGGGSSV
jgi:CHAT domain-containing protein/tetratricopeptide (TPR) repeat protein